MARSNFRVLCAVQLSARKGSSSRRTALIAPNQVQALWPALAALSPESPPLRLSVSAVGSPEIYEIQARCAADGKGCLLLGKGAPLAAALGAKHNDTPCLVLLEQADGNGGRQIVAQLDTAEGLALLKQYPLPGRSPAATSSPPSPPVTEQRQAAAVSQPQPAAAVSQAEPAMARHKPKKLAGSGLAAAAAAAQPEEAAAAAEEAAASRAPGGGRQGGGKKKREREEQLQIEVPLPAAADAGLPLDPLEQPAPADAGRRKRGRKQPQPVPAAAGAEAAPPAAGQQRQQAAEPAGPFAAEQQQKQQAAVSPDVLAQFGLGIAPAGAAAAQERRPVTGRKGANVGRQRSEQPAAGLLAALLDEPQPTEPGAEQPGQLSAGTAGQAAEQQQALPSAQLAAPLPAAAAGQGAEQEQLASSAGGDGADGASADPAADADAAAAAAPPAAAADAAAPAQPTAEEEAGGVAKGDSETEDSFFAERASAQRQGRLKVTGMGQGLEPPTAREGAFRPSPVMSPGSKRARKASRKVMENEEAEVLLRQSRQQRQQAPAAQQQQGQGQRAAAAGAAAGGRGRPRAFRRGHIGGMGGFGASNAKGAAHQPMALLPGEEPLGVELFFGEGRAMRPNGRMGPAPAHAAGEGRALPVPERYGAAVRRARQLLRERMARQGASDAEAEGMLRLLRDYEAKCLAGSEPTTPAECKQICSELNRRLRSVYNRPGQAPLVLDAHVLSGRALQEQGGAGDVQQLRVMERRFLIWTPPDLPADAVQLCAGAQGAADSPAFAAAAAAAAVPEAQPGGSRAASVAGSAAKQDAAQANEPQRGRVLGMLVGLRSLLGRGSSAQLQQQEEEAEAEEAGQQQAGQDAGQPPAGAANGTAWDRGLAAIWREFCGRLQGKRYGSINLATVEDNVSCALNDTEWRDGHLKRVPAKKGLPVLGEIEKCRSGERAGRLYVTDGSMPDYEAQSYPQDAPGMPCGVDLRANAMLPPAVRSDRATNLFHALKSESTGTKTFSLFGPAGGGTNHTAFHFETKRRRSYNLGTGDFIIQPLATQDVMRKLMRVHAAVAGRHTRHGQLLPLEVYLEEGIPLVLHVRDYPFATLCELCEQSMHAFVSFGTVGCSPPALKVSCNDCDLLWELDSCYWLEKLATAYSDLRMFPEEGLPPDGADTWVMSSYMLRRPNTSAQKEGGWKAPWLCEAKGAPAASAGAGGEEVEEEVEEGDMHWSSDIMAVRGVEKMLDVLAGRLNEPAPWAGELPGRELALAVLGRARPVLMDMKKRAVPEDGIYHDGACSFSPRWPEECHFSLEYVDDLVEEVDAELAAAELARQAQRDESAGGAADQRAAKRLRPAAAAGSAASGSSRGSRGPGLMPCLLRPEAHAAYAARGRQAAALLVQQADAMLAAGVAEAQAQAQVEAAANASAALGQEGQQQQGEEGHLSAGAAAEEGAVGWSGAQSAVPSLAGLPPAVLRSHWLLRLQLEWEAALAEPADLALLATRRRQRGEAEWLLDRACQRLAAEHRQEWGVLT